jgi:hypothetical protein
VPPWVAPPPAGRNSFEDIILYFLTLSSSKEIGDFFDCIPLEAEYFFMFSFFSAKKIIFLVAACAVIVAVGGFFIYKNHNSVPKNPEKSLPASIGNLSEKIGAFNEQIKAHEQSFNPAAQNNGATGENEKNNNIAVSQEENTPENRISAALFVGDKKYETSVSGNSSVYDLMEKLQKETDFRFSGKNYPEFGFFVEEINGVKNNPRNFQYWIYYINGQEANMGISAMKLKQGDIIVWKYESSQ